MLHLLLDTNQFPIVFCGHITNHRGGKSTARSECKDVELNTNFFQTNYLSIQRLLGTLWVLQPYSLNLRLTDLLFRFGAAVAIGVYSLFPENAIVLSLFGFAFSLPCFYYAVAKPQYLSASRFVLLTYNLTCLYWYATGSLQHGPNIAHSPPAIILDKLTRMSSILVSIVRSQSRLAYCGQHSSPGFGGRLKRGGN